MSCMFSNPVKAEVFSDCESFSRLPESSFGLRFLRFPGLIKRRECREAQRVNSGGWVGSRSPPGWAESLPFEVGDQGPDEPSVVVMSGSPRVQSSSQRARPSRILELHGSLQRLRAEEIAESVYFCVLDRPDPVFSVIYGGLSGHVCQA